MGSVNITLANGGLGATLQTNDGIAGLVVTGASETGGYTVGTPILISSLSDLATNGITQAGNPFAYRQVKEYYDEAGVTAHLYLLLLPNTVSVRQFADYTYSSGAKILTDYAGGKIKLLGLLTDDTVVYTTSSPVDTTHGINADVLAAATNMSVFAQNYFQNEQPFRAVIGGTSYNGAASTLTDTTAGTTNSRTAIMIGDTQSGAAACVGLALGRLSAVPVQRKISRVRTGALSINQAYLGTATLESLAGTLSAIQASGYITLKKYANVGGYFFSSDETCSSPTDDFHFLARGRVIDKVHMLAYATFVQEADDEVLVNADGTLDSGFCKWLSRQIENQINNTMTAANEISSVSCFIDPTQNILSTNQLRVVLKVTPVGYSSDIEISLGFQNPAA
jgi:Protein of unknown function (DUF2586)